jgi:hypothetical protein
MNDQFSLRRLTVLIRNDVLTGYRTLAIVSATVGLLAVLGPSGLAYAPFVDVSFYRFFFIGVLFVWGTIATSLAFRDLHGRATNTAFLLLPATALEKTASRLIVNTVLLIAYLLLLTSLVSLLGEALELAGRSGRNDLFSPFDRAAWAAIPHYVAVQAVFFLCAAWFRRLHYVKTLLAASALIAAICVGYVALVWLLGWASFSGSGIEIEGDAYDGIYLPLRWLFDSLAFVYFVVLPPFCWLVAWQRVREAQVSHGV